MGKSVFKQEARILRNKAKSENWKVIAIQTLSQHVALRNPLTFIQAEQVVAQMKVDKMWYKFSFDNDWHMEHDTDGSQTWQNTQTEREKQAQIIALLKEKRIPLSSKTIQDQLSINIDSKENHNVYVSLTSNAPESKVEYDPTRETYQYKSFFHGLSNIDDIKAFISSRPSGTSFLQLIDAYNGAEDDVKILLEENSIFQVGNREKQDQILFPTTLSGIRKHEIDGDIKELWISVGATKTKAKATTIRFKKKEKRKKTTKKRLRGQALTNVHLARDVLPAELQEAFK